MDIEMNLTKTPNGYVLELHGHVISLTVDEFNKLYGALFVAHYKQESEKYAKR